jgi:hypothetical protein
MSVAVIVSIFVGITIVPRTVLPAMFLMPVVVMVHSKQRWDLSYGKTQSNPQKVTSFHFEPLSP